MRDTNFILSSFLFLVLAFLSGCVTRPQQTYYPPARSTPAPPPPPPSAPTATANVREITRVTHDAAPSFWPRLSPDGSTLLFTTFDQTKRAQGGESLSIAAVSLREAGRRLVAGPFAQEAAWFPDSKRIVYQYGKTGKPTFVKSPFGGVGMTFVTASPMGEFDDQPDVSPDGQRIAFHTKIGQNFSICTVNVDGTNFTVYVEGTSPRWHPSGKKLAFDREVGSRWQCFVLDLETGQVTQLTSGNASSGFPVWSPDGSWLVFRSDRDGKDHLFVMKADGSAVTQLTKGDSKEDMPEWGSDGFIYFACDAGAPTATPKEGWIGQYSDIWRLKPVLSE